MAYKKFQHLIDKVQKFSSKKKVAVVAAEDEHTLEAVFLAVKEGIIEPVLLGDGSKITAILDSLSVVAKPEIIAVEHPDQAALKAVQLVSQGKADFIMKGKIETANLLRVVVDKSHGLRTGRVMSHIAFFEIPNYPKLLALSDGGMIPYPDLEQKADHHKWSRNLTTHGLYESESGCAGSS